jgi:hypothetical protein
MCQIAMLYLGQVAVENENFFSTSQPAWLNKGEQIK